MKKFVTARSQVRDLSPRAKHDVLLSLLLLLRIMSLPFGTPALDPLVSVAVAGFVATSYVGVLYLFKSTRLVFVQPTSSDPQQQERARYVGEQWRNDPKVIRARLTAVVSSTVFSGLVVVGIVWNAAGRDVRVAR